MNTVHSSEETDLVQEDDETSKSFLNKTAVYRIESALARYDGDGGTSVIRVVPFAPIAYEHTEQHFGKSCLTSSLPVRWPHSIEAVTT